jgi:hypothetical protein
VSYDHDFFLRGARPVFALSSQRFLPRQQASNTDASSYISLASLRLILTFSTLRQEAKETYLPGLSIRTHSLATGLEQHILLCTWLAAKRLSPFTSTDAFSFSGPLPFYRFLFHSLEKKRNQVWDSGPPSSLLPPYSVL